MIVITMNMIKFHRDNILFLWDYYLNKQNEKYKIYEFIIDNLN